MTNAVVVFPPGFRITDASDGSPVSGATIYFYDAGTSTPKTVYADAELTTALGTSVTCDSLGYPTTNGTTKTLVYVGTADYKVEAKTSAGVTIWGAHDYVKGALVEDLGAGSEAVLAETPVVTKSLDYTVVDADQNTVFVGNCSGGTVTLTLPSAVTVGDGWGIWLEHAGTANKLVAVTVSSQTISEGSKSFGTSIALALSGESLKLVSDGGNWRVVQHTGPFVKVAQGIIPIIDRVSAAPGSPVQGGLYLVSGAYSTFSVGDVIQYTGAAYIAFKPYTDCGWVCWVADENLYYAFRGTAWVAESASDTQRGIIETAVQSEMETATDTGRAVVPGRQHYHPGHPKCWLKAAVSGGVPSVSASYNITSITDVSAGYLSVTIATDFSSSNWAALASVESVDGSNDRHVQIADGGQAAGSLHINSTDMSGGSVDPAVWHMQGLGDHA